MYQILKISNTNAFVCSPLTKHLVYIAILAFIRRERIEKAECFSSFFREVSSQQKVKSL